MWAFPICMCVQVDVCVTVIEYVGRAGYILGVCVCVCVCMCVHVDVCACVTLNWVCWEGCLYPVCEKGCVRVCVSEYTCVCVCHTKLGMFGELSITFDCDPARVVSGKRVNLGGRRRLQNKNTSHNFSMI